MQVIARDFTPTDLRTAASEVGVAGSIAVQARQTIEETRWLLDLAQQHEFLLGVVGWVPMVDDDIGFVLDELSPFGKLRGLRHVVQDEPDDDFILGEAFNRGVHAAIERGYVYDILIFERQLPQAIEFATQHAKGRLVLDHIAKPRISIGELEPWRENLRELARRENVACKLSGVVTEAPWSDWSLESIRPFLDTALEAFGPHRLMFGSDWPVCLLASSYKKWFTTVSEWAAELSDDEQRWLFSETAREVYSIKKTPE